MFSAEVEQVGDGIVSGDKVLKMPDRLEPSHLSFTSSCRLMGVLGPIIEALVLAVFDTGHDIPLRRAV